MFLVDTNILLYAADRDAEEHTSARERLEDWRRGGEAWWATWSIFYEFLRVATHRAVLPTPLTLAQGWEFLEAVMASPSFGLLAHTARHREVVGALARRYPGVRGNLVHDFHIAALMYEHGVREIRTADADFHRFDFLTVVNPLRTD